MMDLPFLATVDDARRREMLAAVAHVLVDKNRRAVEMQEVLEQSGMLYEEVSSEFSDLDDVLLSLVMCVSDWICRPVRSHAVSSATYDDMLDALIEFSRRYTHANSTILPGILRVFLTESSRRSQLQRRLYEAGPDAISSALTDFLQSAKSNVHIGGPRSDLIAEALMGMLREPLYYALAVHSKHLFPDLSSINDAPEIVRTFVRGCARRPGP